MLFPTLLTLVYNYIQMHILASIPSRPRWRGEKGGQGVVISYLPKYIFSPPQSAPQCAQKCKTVSGHLGNAVSHVVDSCLSVPSPPPNSAGPPTPSRPLIRHLRQVSQSTCSPKGPYY